MKIRNGLNVFKQNIFYAGYNTLTGEVLTESMYRHRIDTYDYMVISFGEDWKETRPYLTIKLCEVVISESENIGEGNGN